MILSNIPYFTAGFLHTSKVSFTSGSTVFHEYVGIHLTWKTLKKTGEILELCQWEPRHMWYMNIWCDFRYKENEDGFLRLQTIRYESIELTEEIIANKGKGNNLKMVHM